MGDCNKVSNLNINIKLQQTSNMSGNQLVIPPLGFLNTGAICYFNSLVQSLLSCPIFLKTVYRNADGADLSKVDGQTIFALFFKYIVYERQWDQTFTSKLLHLMGGFQPNQSSSEYFLKLADYCKIDKLFESHTETTTTCMNCNHTNRTKDTTSFFMIDDNFNEFSASRRESDGFNCDACKQKVTVIIESKLVSVSPIMVFSFNKYFGKKNIFYPEKFTIDGDKTYILMSTIEHMGVLNAGHYFCRTIRNGDTFTIDDQRVTPLDKLEPLDSTYMVFYMFKE